MLRNKSDTRHFTKCNANQNEAESHLQRNAYGWRGDDDDDDDESKAEA